ncbi:MAG: hypothetical protein IKV61_06645 [Clostridia bacterium]|nr:hypothetical protein [Clostridia bacterium]
MIKKIIVLAISFVLTLGSVVYTETSNAESVTYGSGTGVSRTIASVDELTELINSLPDVTVYDEHANVTSAEGYENFKGITIIENGENSRYYSYEDKVRLDDNPDLAEDEIEYFYSRKHEYSNKRLEMYFDTTCIYYHSIGTTWNTTEYYKTNVEGFLNGNLSDLEIAKGYATDFDIEVFYSKDKVLMKINQNEQYYQEAVWDGKYRVSQFPQYKKAEEPASEEDDEPSDSEIYAEIGLKALNENLGVWVELDLNATGVDGMEPDQDAYENMTDEEKEEYAMNFMIQALISEISYVQVESIKQANAINYAYLSRLSSFIVENIENNKYWEVSGPKYKLVPTYSLDFWKCTQCSKVFETYTTNCPDCEDGGNVNEMSEWIYDARNSYINALRPDWNARVDSTSKNTFGGELEIVVGSNSTINQKLRRTYSSGKSAFGKFEEEIRSYSTIFNVDNTAVNVLKNAKVKTLDETYGKSFRKSFEELRAQQGGNN